MSSPTVPTPNPTAPPVARVGPCPPVVRSPGEQRKTIPSLTRARVYARDAFTCQVCHQGPLPGFTERVGAEPYLTLDHLVEWHIGGCDHEHNLRVACSTCNPSIGNSGPAAEERRKAMHAGALAKRARLKTLRQAPRA